MAILATTTSPSSGNAAPVKSAMRTLDIIEYVVAHPAGVIAQDIAQALAIPVSSLSYLLSTLVERDYLARAGRLYQPGSGLERLRSTPNRLPLIEKVRPLVRTVRTQSNETTSYFVQREWEIEALITETAEHALRYSIGVGTRTPMHCLASGKAILAALGPAALDRYFEESVRKRYTKSTIVDEASLRLELDAARETGIAITREEFTPGICGIGTVLRLDGEVVGSISVAIPTVRYDANVEASTRALLDMAELPA
ncbi:MAG: IclR family transcriptional regulator [Novosphingobium lindaniclasticum]|jgi:IclR family acetate operon transcriptional repressor|uniref:IclR family transcriptional regulator n=1 Tax=Novosphingobium lindaniclasticum TaxID=1329895 RepID=UPI002409D89B|nr:IclR family transcriptional regulator C-terminal domain-containing protein [Novosphingobium lindaniclasticum]MDF2638488.1 IclR family transcriptional regulator [Novosphingobium lindaniclasticum]